MSPLSTLLTTLPLLLALTSAIPTTLHPRDDFPTTLSTCGPQCSHVIFDPDQATCASNKYLQSFSTGVTVTVRPDCDNVINVICQAAEKLATASPQVMSNLNHTDGTCEGHMLFSGPTAVSYGACAQAFQSITESCMVVGDASDRNDAGVGRQFGVRNVVYKVVEGGDDWVAGTSYGQTAPGYLIGPTPGVWGTDNWGGEKDAADVLGGSA